MVRNGTQVQNFKLPWNGWNISISFFLIFNWTWGIQSSPLYSLLMFWIQARYCFRVWKIGQFLICTPNAQTSTSPYLMQYKEVWIEAFTGDYWMLRHVFNLKRKFWISYVRPVMRIWGFHCSWNLVFYQLWLNKWGKNRFRMNVFFRYVVYCLSTDLQLIGVVFGVFRTLYLPCDTILIICTPNTHKSQEKIGKIKV